MDRLQELRGASALTLSKLDPRLRTKIGVADDKPYGGPVSINSRVLNLISAQGRIVRGQPSGSWSGSQYEWAPVRALAPGRAAPAGSGSDAQVHAGRPLSGQVRAGNAGRHRLVDGLEPTRHPPSAGRDRHRHGRSRWRAGVRAGGRYRRGRRAGAVDRVAAGPGSDADGLVRTGLVHHRRPARVSCSIGPGTSGRRCGATVGSSAAGLSGPAARSPGDCWTTSAAK